jgi:hypothetical protein
MDVPLPASAWAGTDTQGFLDLVRRHRCGVLVADAVRACPPGVLPDELAGRLRHDAYAGVARSTRLARQHASVIQGLKGGGVEALAVKGAALGMLANGDPGYRFFDDLDLLVHKRDFAAARDFFVKEGYRPEFMAPVRAHTWGGWDCFMWSADRTHGVELSVSMMPRHFFRLPESVLWEGAYPLRLDDGGELPVPSDEVHFVLLCAHGSKHAWNRAAWMADIAGMLVRCDRMRWDRVRDIAQRYGAARMVRVGLILASEVCGIGIPKDMQADVESDCDAPLLAEKVLDALRAGDGSEPSKGTAMGFHLRVKDRWRDKVAYVLRLALTPGYSDWANGRFPDRSYPLYYVTRPFRLLISIFRTR